MKRFRVEHDAAVREFIAQIESVPADAWQSPMAPGKWTYSQLGVHLIRAYEFGRDAANGAAQMRLRLPPWGVFVSKHLLLPAMLLLDRFPRGATAPFEVRPDLELARSLTQVAAAARLKTVAAEAAAALESPSVTRLQHAYFGEISPARAQQVLSAHTRHHTRQLAARLATLGR